MSEDREPTEEEVLAHLAHVAGKVASRIAEEAFEPGPARDAALEAAKAVVLDDEGARELLAAAYEEGKRDAAGAMLRARGAVAPDWSDVESLGERRMIAREESICGACENAPICRVASAVPGELLVVITRCGAYRER